MKQQKRCMRRPCIRCDKPFYPATKYTKICDKCIEKSWKKRLEENKMRREAKIKVMKDVT